MKRKTLGGTTTSTRDTYVIIRVQHGHAGAEAPKSEVFIFVIIRILKLSQFLNSHFQIATDTEAKVRQGSV